MIGLHYWTSLTEYGADNPNHANSSVVQDLLKDFVNGGLLRKLDKPNEHGSTYERTDALEVWVKALCNVPWPVQAWVIPERERGL